MVEQNRREWNGTGFVVRYRFDVVGHIAACNLFMMTIMFIMCVADIYIQIENKTRCHKNPVLIITKTP